MIRATEPQKDRMHEATSENDTAKNSAETTQHIGLSRKKFNVLLEEGIEKYDDIWKSLADK
jgi:hypothetical protein